MRTGILLSFILLLSSCFRKPIPVSCFHTGEFILEDTSLIANEYLQSFEDGFPIYYLGPSKDTINIGTRYWRRGECRFKEYPTYCIFRYSTSNISVHVDTSFPVCEPLNILIKKDLLTIIVTQTVTIMLQLSLYAICATQQCHWELLSA